MVLRDLLLEKEMVEHEDGYGGHTQTLHNAKNIQCKISVNTNPAISNIFGTFDEKILYVWSREALSQNYLYEYRGNNYTVRAQEKNNRFYYSILIEEKPTYTTKEGK